MIEAAQRGDRRAACAREWAQERVTRKMGEQRVCPRARNAKPARESQRAEQKRSQQQSAAERAPAERQDVTESYETHSALARVKRVVDREEASSAS